MWNAKFVCSECQAEHDCVLDLVAPAPVPWSEMALEERATRGRITDEVCEIDGEQHYVRAVLQLPIVQTDQHFAYGVWVSLSKASFARYEALGGHDRGQGDAPFFGWLSVRLPGYPDTFCLKTRVHLRPAPDRPQVELEPTTHPLAMEQRLGIRLARAYEIVEAALHPGVRGTGSTFVHVSCGPHGEGHGCLVCIHLASDTGAGFFWDPTPGDPWPYAWCSHCEARLRESGWTDEVIAQLQTTVVCDRCYSEIRAARGFGPDPRTLPQ